MGLIDDLFDIASRRAEGRDVVAVSIGPTYIVSVLDNGAAGLMTTPVGFYSEDCTLVQRAGELEGPAREVLDLFRSPRPIEAAVGASVLNALVKEEADGEADPFDLSPPKPGEKVVFIGYFKPYIRRAREMGCDVRILESRDVPFERDVYPSWAAERVLPDADYVVITGSSLYSWELEDYVSLSSSAREVMVVGPSTPMARSPFSSTPVTGLFGMGILDPWRATKIVVQGGGTRALLRSGVARKEYIRIKRK